MNLARVQWKLDVIVTAEPSLQHRADIVSDDVAADNNNVELIDQIILNADDLETLISKLSELRGQWPYRDKSECNKMNTRDHGYYRYKQRGQIHAACFSVIHNVW
jgi:hypothetical protein